MSEAGLARKLDIDTCYRLHLEALREGRSNIQDNENVKILRLVELKVSYLCGELDLLPALSYLCWSDYLGVVNRQGLMSRNNDSIKWYCCLIS